MLVSIPKWFVVNVVQLVVIVLLAVLLINSIMSRSSLIGEYEALTAEYEDLYTRYTQLQQQSDYAYQQLTRLMNVSVIYVGGDAPYAITHPCESLSSWTLMPISEAPINRSMVVVGTPVTNNLIAEIGADALGLSEVVDEGYVIKTVSYNGVEHVVVTGNTVRGAMYGTYAMLRELKVANIRYPFLKEWDISSKPEFPLRAVYVNPIPWVMENFTADTWTIDQWKDYIDSLCMAGANQIQIAIWECVQGYNPASNYTDPRYAKVELSSKALWETWREMIRYAHNMSIEAYVGFAYNEVDFGFYYRHKSECGAVNDVYGADDHGLLCWSRGKSTIVEYKRFLFQYFSEADGFVVWLLDIGDCFCDQCKAHKNEIVVDVVNTFKPLMESFNPNIEIVLNLWATWRTWQIGNQYNSESIMDALNKSVTIMDDPLVCKLETPSHADNIRLAISKGFKAELFAYPLGPEGLFPWPRPNPKGTDRYVANARDSNSEGIVSYRIAAITQFITDHYLFRKLWDPAINYVTVCDEIAGFICDSKTAKVKLSLGMQLLGDWSEPSHTRNAATMEQVRDLFAEAYDIEPGLKIERLRDCAALLVYVSKAIAAGSDKSKQEQQFEAFWTEFQKAKTFQVWATEFQKANLHWWFFDCWLPWLPTYPF